MAGQNKAPGTRKVRGFLPRCRLCWRVTAAVFAGILLIEAAILVPSYRNYERDRLQALANSGRSGDVSWMLDPEGTNTRGTSSGVGDVTLSQSAERVRGYIRTENAVAMARMQVIDATGAVVREVSATNTGWTEVAHQVTAGEARITGLRFVNDGGGMAALDDFEFATTSASDSGGGGGSSDGLDALLLVLFAGLGLLRLRGGLDAARSGHHRL